MRADIIDRVLREEEVAIKKWGATDRSAGTLLNAVIEEVGEVAHALNHKEGVDQIQQEIVESIGLLSRLYDWVERYPSNLRW